MRSAIKWVGALCFAALLLVLVAGTVLWRSVTPSSGQLASSGLERPVAIVRDEHAVAHIEAATFEDAAHALGFVHAQERLWQMEVLRRTAGGRLAELFGEPARDFDVFLRTLGMARAAETSVAALRPRTRAVLEAYAAGVNAWAGRKRGLLEPALPPEFLLFSVRFEPWEPADSAAVMKLMSLQLSKNIAEELKRFALAARGLRSDEIGDLLPHHPDDDPPPLPDLRELLPLQPVRDVISNDVAAQEAGFRGVPVSEWASNSWVLAGSRTKTSAPLLANDPHLAFGAPSLWYLAHLRWETRNLVGATLPGTPLVLLGRNDDVAWGFTNAGADVQDIFIERVQAGERNSYLTPSGWRPFERRTETVRVRGKPDVTFEVLSTRHGPVLPDRLPLPSDAPMVFSNILRELYVPALAWTGADPDDRTLDALVAMAAARSVDEVRAALAPVVSPMQAVVVADRAGDIALVTPARVPLRPGVDQVQGRAPVPGWTGDHDWTGFAQADDIPGVRNPTSGAIVTANTRLPNAGALHLTYDWDEPARQRRAAELVEERAGDHDVASMAAIQNDAYSAPLLQLRDTLLELHAPDAGFAHELRGWDGRMDRAARAPLLMMAWAREVNRGLLADDLGTAYPRFDDLDHHALRRMLSGGARDWCDDRTTERREACGEVVAAAWARAETGLRQVYGDDPATWGWGEAHRVRHAHQPFDRVPLLRRLFSIERPAAGGPHTLDRGRTDLGSDEPFVATHGAGYKAIYDLADPERSLFVQTTGQSGNPFSRHYRSFATLWADGGYIAMTTDPETYRARSMGIWRLRPN